MAIYLLDTTAFSAIMDEHPRVLAHADALSPVHLLVTCAIVRGEVLFGLERMPEGRKQRHLEMKAANLFEWIPCEPVPVAAGDIYARIKHDAETQGTPLDDNDLWIAATTLHLGARLVTSDTDFRRINSLPTEDWTA